MFTSVVIRVLRVINFCWYMMLLPVWLVVVVLSCLQVRERSNRLYNMVLERTGLAHLATRLNVDDGELPLSVLLALVLPPLYLYSLIFQSDVSFVYTQAPLMMLYYLVCSDSCHYESHLWLARLSSSSRSKLTWYHRTFGLRFKQYALSCFYPLPQHIPHLLVHHKINMAHEQDVDWVGDLRRDSLVDFCKFLSRFDWRTYLHGLSYIQKGAAESGSYRLLIHLYMDLFFTVGLYAFCFWLSPVKGIFQYGLHSLLNYRLAFITYFIEHLYHHPIAGSYNHPWHATTIFDEEQFSSDSHAAHHHRAIHTVEQNSTWANSAVFVVDQIKHRNLALKLDTRFDEWIMLPYLAMTKQYSELLKYVYFVPEDKLQGKLTTKQLEDYRAFKAEITAEELQRRLAVRTDAQVAPNKLHES